jgi:hypothetical protein
MGPITCSIIYFTNQSDIRYLMGYLEEGITLGKGGLFSLRLRKEVSRTSNPAIDRNCTGFYNLEEFMDNPEGGGDACSAKARDHR